MAARTFLETLRGWTFTWDGSRPKTGSVNKFPTNQECHQWDKSIRERTCHCPCSSPWSDTWGSEWQYGQLACNSCTGAFFSPNLQCGHIDFLSWSAWGQQVIVQMSNLYVYIALPVVEEKPVDFCIMCHLLISHQTLWLYRVASIGSHIIYGINLFIFADTPHEESSSTSLASAVSHIFPRRSARSNIPIITVSNCAASC